MHPDVRDLLQDIYEYLHADKDGRPVEATEYDRLIVRIKQELKRTVKL